MPEPKLSPAQFAAKIKSQYPQYKDIEDDVLVQKVINKYPTYADKVELEVKKKEPSVSLQRLPEQEPTLASSSEDVSSLANVSASAFFAIYFSTKCQTWATLLVGI